MTTINRLCVPIDYNLANLCRRPPSSNVLLAAEHIKNIFKTSFKSIKEVAIIYCRMTPILFLVHLCSLVYVKMKMLVTIF